VQRDDRDRRLTLEDLSAATGMTARNVRAYQTKGLIPPPVRQGRRSMYSGEHLRRLQAIERARARGASLALIASHLAQGRPLDDDTLISWPDEPHSDASRPRAEIGDLLARLDGRRDDATRGAVEALVAGGVLQREGRSLYAGPELAAALTALPPDGRSVQVALGLAQRAMAAAVPLAETVRTSVPGTDASLVSRLGEIVGCVVRVVVANHVGGS
jgi:DNA-binding transcriptional MerR regulator